MAGNLVELGPKMDWTRENKIYDHYLIWKVENHFCSILAEATPQQKTGYLRLWMGDEGVPLIKKWISTGKIDFSNRNSSHINYKKGISFEWIHYEDIMG